MTRMHEMDDAEFFEIVRDEPFSFFEARLREGFASRGWEFVGSDDGRDYFARGRWELYASPANHRLGPGFRFVMILDFPTEDIRRRFDLGEDMKTQGFHQVLSVNEAIELLVELDPTLKLKPDSYPGKEFIGP
jgi:hypothetical protein